MTQPPNPSRPAMTEAEREAMVADLARVKALFQARTIAAVIGAPMPRAEDFARANQGTPA